MWIKIINNNPSNISDLSALLNIYIQDCDISPQRVTSSTCAQQKQTQSCCYSSWSAMQSELKCKKDKIKWKYFSVTFTLQHS